LTKFRVAQFEKQHPTSVLKSLVDHFLLLEPSFFDEFLIENPAERLVFSNFITADRFFVEQLPPLYCFPSELRSVA
jgi:hypothetical protein